MWFSCNGGQTNMLSRKFLALRSYWCNRDAIHTPLHLKLITLDTGGTRHPVLFASHEQHHCHHPSNSRSFPAAPSMVPSVEGLVRIHEMLHLGAGTRGKEIGSYKSFKSISSSSGKQFYSLFSTKYFL